MNEQLYANQRAIESIQVQDKPAQAPFVVEVPANRSLC